jgi:hypothetical protein
MERVSPSPIPTCPLNQKNAKEATETVLNIIYSFCKDTKLESSRLTHLSETKVMRNHGVEFPTTRGNIQNSLVVEGQKFLLQPESVEFDYSLYWAWMISSIEQPSLILIKKCSIFPINYFIP